MVPTAARRAPTPDDFALLWGLESAVRGLMLSVIPLSMYRAWGEGELVSGIYTGVGALSLGAGLMVPALTRRLPRGRVVMTACGLYVAAMALQVAGGRWLMPLALLVSAVATVSFWVCLSAYVLDWVPREALARAESRRLLYGAAAWSAGPFLGVWLLDLWRPLPFVLAAGFALALAGAFRRLGLGDGKPVGAAGGSALGFLGTLAHRPRLLAGWTFATVRSSGWWVYIVYLPLFAIETGLGDRVGGAAVSLSSLLLFATPALGRVVARVGVRRAVRGTFAWCAAFFLLAAALSPWPWATVACLVLASGGLVMLDVCGSLPFLMAVKPSERTEMAAVYSSFRDASGIASPAVGGLVLLVAPVAGVFAACGAALAGAGALAGTLHPRLGLRRGPSR